MNFFENFNDIMFLFFWRKGNLKYVVNSISAKLNFEVQRFFLFFFHLFLNSSNTFSFDYLQKSENCDNIEIC